MVQIGGHEATLRDFEIPARYGLRQTIGDTLGIGGIFRTLRTAPHMLALGHEMAELCRRGLAPQLHEPDGGALRARLSGHADEERRRALPLGAVASCATSQSSSASRPRRSRSSRPGSTTRRSSCASSTTASRSTRGSTSGSPATRSCSAACASRSTAGSATSRPSRASTLPSTCRGSCATTTSSSATASRSASTSAAARRTSSEFARVKGALARGEAMPLERSNGVRGDDRQLDGHRRAERRSTATSPNTGLIPALPEGTCVEVPCVVERNGAAPDAGARLPAAARGAEPHLCERRRADRSRGARGAARLRPASRRCSTRTRRRL